MLRLGSSDLVVLPVNMRGCSCSICDKRQSVWSMVTEDGIIKPVCSICWLYDSDWGTENKDSVDDFVGQVRDVSEKDLSVVDGRLVDCSQADGVIGSVLFISRIYESRYKNE